MYEHWDEITKVRGIPLTGPSRTLLDLGQVLTDDELERALREAERLQLTDTVSVVDLLERYPRRRGSAAIRRLTAVRELYKGVTRSELEERFRQFLRTHEIPDPEWNVRLELDQASLEVDCLWREERLVVELDGYGYHAGLDAFERDRLRDRLLQLAGLTPIRITWRALRDDVRLAPDLRAILG
jgi:very-short-patch-repair endonuclease